MYERFKYHLQFIKNREIVLWGTGKIAREIVDIFEEAKIDFSFSVSNDIVQKDSFGNKPVKPKNILKPDLHYVIIVNSFHEEVKKELDVFGFTEKLDYYCNNKGILNYDIEYNGVFIGKNTYGHETLLNKIGSAYNFFKSIGRYTSINNTVNAQVDHALGALSMGSLSFIDKEKQDLLNKKYKYPFTYNNIIIPPPQHLEIGNDVWIGANAFINLSKVRKIGNGAVIGAGAVVLEDVPPYSVVVGVPGKIKKYRFSEEEIEILERIKWWDWDDKKLNEHAECFFNPKLFFEMYK